MHPAAHFFRDFAVAVPFQPEREGAQEASPVEPLHLPQDPEGGLAALEGANSPIVDEDIPVPDYHLPSAVPLAGEFAP